MFNSCVNTNSGPDEEGIEEITNDDPNSPSSIIRNPISAQGLKDTINIAKFDFDKERFEFGEAYEGDVILHTFKFTNTGKVPLVIQDARSTCGCTVPTWPKEPIAPGSNGEINIEFNTKGKTGKQEKPVTITANTYPGKTVLYISGRVHKNE